jgi:hypothetical protein
MTDPCRGTAGEPSDRPETWGFGDAPKPPRPREQPSLGPQGRQAIRRNPGSLTTVAPRFVMKSLASPVVNPSSGFYPREGQEK